MVMRRRRRGRRSFAGRSNGRNFFWIRQQPFTLSQWTTNPLIISNTIADEATWSDPSADLNQTKKGAPRLERFIINYGIGIEAAQDWFAASGEANFNFIPEVMAFVQSDQFATVVQNTAQFDNTLVNQRVVMHEVPRTFREFIRFDESGAGTPKYIRTVQGHYETKSKVNLREKAIGLALRGNADFGSANVFGWVDWFQPTMLISIP